MRERKIRTLIFLSLIFLFHLFLSDGWLTKVPDISEDSQNPQSKLRIFSLALL